MHIRIGTRKSELAVYQAKLVAEKITQKFPDICCELIKINTTGDILYNENLALIGGKGLFLKEIEAKLLLNEIDIAVHSLKDMPAFLPQGLKLSCVLSSHDSRDVLVSPKYKTIDKIPHNGVIGTCSARRAEYIKMMRPDINIVSFRGNINTRIKKISSGEVDGAILAYAGLIRLNLTDFITQIFGINEMLPAIGQGIIGIENCLNSSNEIDKVLSVINDKNCFIRATAERVILQELNGNCSDAIAAHAIIANNTVAIQAAYKPKNFTKFITAQLSGKLENYHQIAKNIVNKINQHRTIND